MSYQQALEKAWGSAGGLSHEGEIVSIKFLSDTYTINLKDKTIFSDSCNTPAKEHVSIILLHYLSALKKSPTLPAPTGEWIDFKELQGGEGYYPAFKKRTIDRIIKKYGTNPDALKDVLGRIPGRAAEEKDVSIVINPLKEVSILIIMTKADEEFGPDANILFDKNISDIFCTEDVVVLTEFIVHMF